MSYIWVAPVFPGAPIVAGHVVELRAVIQRARLSHSLQDFTWGDAAVTGSSGIKASHFLEMRQAIQDVWTAAGIGALPPWTSAALPNGGVAVGRTVYASDVNDLRAWVARVDPPLCGYHWPNQFGVSCGASLGARYQINGAGAGSNTGFGTAIVVGDTAFADQVLAEVDWLKGNMRCPQIQALPPEMSVIVRLYFPPAEAPTALPDPHVLAGIWGGLIRGCQSLDVFNFVVLNEPNVEYPGNLWPPNPGYMGELALAIRFEQAIPGKPIGLGFPGPAPNSLPPYEMYPGHPSGNWETFWDGYASIINEQYNFIAPHAFGGNGTQLRENSLAIVSDVRNRFPYHPQRVTEFGIPIDEGPQGNHSVRANWYRDFIEWARDSGEINYVTGLHVYIGACATPDQDKWQLTDLEVAQLISQVGCVGP